jgi:hypothetical protein
MSSSTVADVVEPTCKWCGHKFLHAEYHAQHEGACVDRPGASFFIDRWASLDRSLRDSFLEWLGEQEETWRKCLCPQPAGTARVVLDLLRELEPR